MSTNGSDLEFPVSVYQAQGMVAVQADCSLDDALALMTSSAEATYEKLLEVADEVISGRVRFAPPD
jgi:hypothetical protein